MNEPRLTKKAFALWREFARDARALDVEALEALALRDYLAGLELSVGQQGDLRRLDLEVFHRAREIVRQLRTTGAWSMVDRRRREMQLRNAWWWLDGHFWPASVVAKPVATHPARGRLERHEAELPLVEPSPP